MQQAVVNKKDFLHWFFDGHSVEEILEYSLEVGMFPRHLLPEEFKDVDINQLNIILV